MMNTLYDNNMALNHLFSTWVPSSLPRGGQTHRCSLRSLRRSFRCQAHDAYQSASETAISELPATHPVRLGLALNFSVFYYEVFSSPEAWTGVGK